MDGIPCPCCGHTTYWFPPKALVLSRKQRELYALLRDGAKPVTVLVRELYPHMDREAARHKVHSIIINLNLRLPDHGQRIVRHDGPYDNESHMGTVEGVYALEAL